ncbi:MAG: hypothetical protein HY898_12590 [Deltaproteobacteria bacterium]|nr:hypothetical protein [Deltaproteobacteria bacterium]
MRKDRLLAIMTGALAIGAWIPLFCTPILPFADMPNNAGLASLIIPTGFGHGVAAFHYKVQWQPLPYWSAYALMALFSSIGGILFSCKAITALLVVLLPLATMRLMVALGRNPRLGLWAFILSYEHNLYGGWVTYLLGMSLTLIAIAWMLEARTLKDALWVFPLSLLIGLTHIQAVWLLMAASVALTVCGRPFLRRVWLHGVASSGCLIVVTPWLLRQFAPEGGAPSAPLSSMVFEWITPSVKAASFFKFTLDNITTQGGARFAAFAFAVVLFGPLLISRLPHVQDEVEQRGASSVLLVVMLGLYVLLPMSFSGPIVHWYTYPRYATFVLIALLLIPRPRLDGRYALALIPGIVTAVGMDWAVARHFSDLAVRSAPFVQIIKAVKPNSTILPLQFDQSDPSLPPIEVYSQFGAYVAGQARGYEPNMFDTGSNPLVYRHERDLPNPGWSAPGAFSMEKHGRYFDYILVQGKSYDPVHPGVRTASGHTARLLVEAGRWRLYKVEK